MGLIKEALEAIIRIDRNLAAIRKALTKASDDTLYRVTYMQKPIEPKGSTYDRVMTEKGFCYPDCLTFGGRVRAIRLFAGLTQAEFGSIINVSNGHISNVERDEDVLSTRAIKDVADKFNIDRHWLATGELGSGDPADQASETIKLCFQRAMKEFEPEPPPKRTYSSSGIQRPPDDSYENDPTLQRLRELGHSSDTEQALCETIAQSLRSAGEEAGSDRQGRVHCSRYPSRCTQGSSDK